MIKLIVAHDPNFLIGKDGGLPWSIREDLLHFKNETLNKTVLMGYTTFKSLNYKPLKNRENETGKLHDQHYHIGIRV